MRPSINNPTVQRVSSGGKVKTVVDCADAEGAFWEVDPLILTDPDDEFIKFDADLSNRCFSSDSPVTRVSACTRF